VVCLCAGGVCAGQWMAVDLGEKNRMALSHYALRTSQVSTTTHPPTPHERKLLLILLLLQVNRLCQWELQAKVNDSEASSWVTLHRHGAAAGSSRGSEDPYEESLFAIASLAESSSDASTAATAAAVGAGDGGPSTGGVGSGTSSAGGGGAAYGEVYQCFRIVQTGVNSGGGHHLFCSGIELYGSLYYGSP
jgi:hypothetical protein